MLAPDITRCEFAERSVSAARLVVAEKLVGDVHLTRSEAQLYPRRAGGAFIARRR